MRFFATLIGGIVGGVIYGTGMWLFAWNDRPVSYSIIGGMLFATAMTIIVLVRDHSKARKSKTMNDNQPFRYFTDAFFECSFSARYQPYADSHYLVFYVTVVYFGPMSGLIEVARFFDPEEAYCADAFLRSRGVVTLIQNEHHLNVVPWLRIALGGYAILCPAQHAELAVSALSEARSTHSGLMDHSGEKQSEHLFKTNWFWLPTFLAISIPFVPVYRTKVMLALQLFLLPFLYVLAAITAFWWIRY